MEVIKKLTTNNCYKDRNHPKFIVIHETDNTSKGADALKHAQALGNGNLKTSVHYFVDDKCVVQTLEHKHGAWAVGKTYGTPLVPGVTNLNTINIEICVNRDGNYNKARQNCIAFTKQLMKQTSIPASRVIRHYDAKKKTCPRHMVENQALWTDFKKQLTSATPTPAKARIGTGLVYANDIDRVSAEALQLEIRDATLIPLSALNKYKVQHLIAIGAAGNSLKGEAETILQGADRVDTLFKVTDYIKEMRSK